MPIRLAPYADSLALLTDLYQLTMAYGYWKSGRAEEEAVFHLFFRDKPFRGGFALAAGLENVVQILRCAGATETGSYVDASDLDYLARLTGNDGRPLFEPAFLEALGALRLRCDIDAIPEGTVVFPHEPLVRVRGPIWHCQLLETLLLNLVNFPTLIATKAARVCLAARGALVLEFGLRRAQGIDGALTASRAAYIGGCAGTSNVLAGKLYGIPVKGTHAHSWVMFFESEDQAFDAYADAMPNNCVFLVDTYDTLEGVKRAVRVGKRLRAQGHELVGVRLDSGDLAWLSREARRLLDEAGFDKAAIVASNDLDEHLIDSLIHQGARIDVWGVGTKLATAYDQPALGAVYKLSAVRDHAGKWQPKIKLSEQAVKTSTPGVLQVRRFTKAGEYCGDMIYDIEQPLPERPVAIDPIDLTRRRRFDNVEGYEDLLVPVFRQGELVMEPPPLESIRARARAQLDKFHAGVKRLHNPHAYPVGLEDGLHRLKTDLVLRARNDQF